MSCVLVKRFRVRRGASPSPATSSRLDWVSIEDTLDADDVRKSGLGLLGGASIAMAVGGGWKGDDGRMQAGSEPSFYCASTNALINAIASSTWRLRNTRD